MTVRDILQWIVEGGITNLDTEIVLWNNETKEYFFPEYCDFYEYGLDTDASLNKLYEPNTKHKGESIMVIQ